MSTAGSNGLYLTLDMDWAPDWMLEDCLRVLVDANAPATWFVTHQTPVLDELRKRPDLFELGIHPNCLAGSSHGADEAEVLGHMLDLLPEAVTMRTHGLYQCTPFLARAAAMGVENDVSLFLPWVQGLEPHVLPFPDWPLVRLPYFWEDDVAMLRPDAPWGLDAPDFQGPGLKIFDFHPVHVALNTRTMKTYDGLKELRPLSQWTREFAAEHVSTKPGPADLFAELAQVLGQRANGPGGQMRSLAAKTGKGGPA